MTELYLWPPQPQSQLLTVASTATLTGFNSEPGPAVSSPAITARHRASTHGSSPSSLARSPGSEATLLFVTGSVTPVNPLLSVGGGEP